MNSIKFQQSTVSTKQPTNPPTDTTTQTPVPTHSDTPVVSETSTTTSTGTTETPVPTHSDTPITDPTITSSPTTAPRVCCKSFNNSFSNTLLTKISSAVGVRAYNSDTSINGISAGVNFDGFDTYAGFIDVGLIIPGGVQAYFSQLSGIIYSYKAKLERSDKNVSFLTQNEGCACQFVPKDDPLPTGATVVRVGPSYFSFGIGSITYNSDDTSNIIAIGRIDDDTNTFFYYPNIFDMSEVNTTTGYKRLICRPTQDTTTTPAVTTPPELSTEDQITALQNEIDALLLQDSYDDATANEQITTLIVLVQDLLNDPSLRNEPTIAYLKELLAALQELIAVEGDVSGAGRRKRQAVSQFSCDSVTESLSDVYNDGLVYEDKLRTFNAILLKFTAFKSRAETLTLGQLAPGLNIIVDIFSKRVENVKIVGKNTSRKGVLLATLQPKVCAASTKQTAVTLAPFTVSGSCGEFN
jgi:hypothetical protein